MSNGNHVSITGNLTRDPELRFTPSGQATASFGVAVNRRWQNRQTGDWDEATSYFDVVCWGQLAENAAQSLGRGTRVVVSGRLDQRSWETQEGERRSKIEITADEVAPSLRWATATVSKNERRSPDGGGSGSGGYQQQAGSGGQQQGPPRAAEQGGGVATSRPAASEAQGGYRYEEEPF
jgi:single-strand DNA-binding protein